ncbi:MAG: ABC transporter ATP-binding protein [Betaproteobacteria bacterium]|jgi:putative ABC transport system ATP-binding protein|nr:ABC transporter ATP-binding protein [Betaproteobacteria bacterium]
MTSSIAVSTRGIVKDFRTGDSTARVLHGIDIDLNPGELTMLVGPSGCGKTTLLSIITGILTPTAGSVSIFGTDIGALSDSKKVAFRRHRLGFIFQQYNLLPALTAAENASLPLVAAGSPLQAAARAAAAILERIGMGAHLDKTPAQLSGGQQQRVAIARAMVHGPCLVVCDEPTAALDAQTGLAVMDSLREIALDTGRAVLVVTHDTRIFNYADRIVTMNDGHIESDQPTGGIYR